jgi:hypothetical protein
MVHDSVNKQKKGARTLSFRNMAPLPCTSLANVDVFY